MSLPVHDPVLIFTIVMLIVLVAPLLFTRLRVPGLVGLIVFGAVVGPSGMGLLARDQTMILLGTVGLLYLMFVAGLGLDLAQFNRQKSRSLTFGLLSFFVPQIMGIWAGLHVLEMSLASALLLGSIVGSHTLLAYPIASRLGISRNGSVIMTMGGTIVTDLLALLLLAAVVAASNDSLNPAFWIRFLSAISIYFFVVLKVLPKVARWFLRTTHGEPNVAFVFLTTALFVTAYAAQFVGLAPIIGAFLAGIVLNRLVPEIGPLMSRVKFVGETLFIPFFLLSVGMLVDFGVLLGSFEVWLIAGLFTGLVLIGKGLAAGAACLLYRRPAREAWVVFGLTIPQAAATLAVTLVGYNLGLFEELAVNAVVVMIMITCMIGPWLVERFGRQIALKEEAQPSSIQLAPQRILIPLSNPSTADMLVDVALAIRAENSDEAIFPLAVVRDDGDVAGQVAAGERLLSGAVLHTVAADVPVNPLTRVDADVARGVTRAVAERRISHLVIGWGGNPSPRQRIFGNILDRLLDLTAIPVLVCRLSQPLNTFSRVVLVVPPLVERDVGFPEVLVLVKRMAARLGTELQVIFATRHRDRIEAALGATTPEVPFSLAALSSFNGLNQTLSDTLTPDSLLVLLNARETQRSWQPALDRLPRSVAQRFPRADFIVLYPHAEDRSQAERQDASDVAASITTPPVRVVSDLMATTLPGAIIELLERSFADPSEFIESLHLSLPAERDYLLQELVPGVVLLHGHTTAVDHQEILMGIALHEIESDATTASARILLILLNPEGLPPEYHLNALARVARAVHATRGETVSDEPVDPAALLDALSP